MGLRIATNVQALTAQRNMGAAVEANTASMEKLSSGFRINKASDDAAGLAISEKLKADVRSLGVAKRNANDGISLIQTAEGGLNEVGNILIRLRELSVQGASDTIGQTERGFLNKEFGQLKEEITRIAKSTEYNGTLLLVGKQDDVEPELREKSNSFPLEIQVGKNFVKGIDGDKEGSAVNLIRINLEDINATVGDSGLGLGEGVGEDVVNVVNKETAQKSISSLDSALEKVAGHRATLGSIQSRLTSTINNLSIATENASAANSRIRDTDFAEESAKLMQTNIIKQSGVAVLSQANSAPQLALRLLG